MNNMTNGSTCVALITWPIFDVKKLSLSQAARQQFGRIYSDIKTYPKAAQRKSGLLNWIYSSAYDPVKGLHLPVTTAVKVASPYGPVRSQRFLNTVLNFPKVPCDQLFFSNALIIGSEAPSLRGTNSGRIVVTHEIDTDNLAEFEEVLEWTRGVDGDFGKSPFAGLDRRLCEFSEYRGYSIVYSGRRSLHFHFFFDTRHLEYAPWEADALLRSERKLDTAALMQNVHNLYWDHAGDAIAEILQPTRPVDPSMRTLTKWRRMPWGIRTIEEGKDCSFLNIMAGDRIPQLVIHEKILERASKKSALLVPETLSTAHPKPKSNGRSTKTTEFAGEQTEAILIMQEQCRVEWVSEFPKPVKVLYQSGEPIIKFQNHQGDKNPSSYVLGEHRTLVILGNGGPTGDLYLPDHMNASEFVEFALMRCGVITIPAVSLAAPVPGQSEKRSKAKRNPFEELGTKRFDNQPIYSSKPEAQNSQRELLKQAIGHLRGSDMSYLIKSAEGFGKTTSHFLPVEDEMLDIAINQFGEDFSQPTIWLLCLPFLRSGRTKSRRISGYVQMVSCYRNQILQ